MDRSIAQVTRSTVMIYLDASRSATDRLGRSVWPPLQRGATATGDQAPGAGRGDKRQISAR